MNWFRNFMSGRYGNDILNYALLVTGLVLSFVARFTGEMLFIYVSYAPLFFAMYRMMSRNIGVRINENIKFMKYYMPIEKKAKEWCTLTFGTSTHRYFKCPNCGQKVRVPKGRGKILIKCPKCHTEFTKKA